MLKELKNGKAEGVDDIPGEMLKCLGEKATEELIEIMPTDIYNWEMAK